MKSIAILAGAVAVAAADSYGQPSYETPSSSAKPAYTTINPGYGHAPVTVTKQYQAVPTYDASGKSSEYLWVSTVIKGCNGEPVTITKTNQKVVLYSTKSTATRYRTEPAAGYAAPTGYFPKNSTATPVVKPYFELYEKVHEAKYKDLGPKALPGYKGNKLYKGSKDKQKVTVKEFENGKWNKYVHTFDYGVPKPSATTFATPGVYTIPAYEKTITKYETVAAETTYTAQFGDSLTYGGYTITVTETEPTTITTKVPQSYQTEGTKTITVYKTEVVTCTGAGEYEVEKPTTTKFEQPTTFVYPTTTVYPPGFYHHDAETVTVTKSNEPYTCKFQSTDKPSYPISSTTKGYNGYPTSSYVPYPVSSSTKEYETYPSSSSAQEYETYPTSSSTKEYETYPTSSSTKEYETYPTSTASEYETYPTSTASEYEVYPTSTASEYEVYPTSTASEYEVYPTSTASEYEVYPTSTATEYETYPSETPSKTSPPVADPSSDYEEPLENYGTPNAGYVKRGGLIERRKAEPQAKQALNRRVILV
ncbi:hypothetical protein BU24DRAFT_491852 [Aaosphaeria arxii CBS 175.79]|uniref:Uncharacterized protein n=1 Tax=Aaosphaeria arxii CBS 175.79 TaxID=1450172 RepID=A0A6A5XRS6_9PLEO|nr:uncharacterized protein BU24DRAFT_491852 [Aaosphaeria arxii CBS 175.79]KAF2015633.1 hypothetical protein BU24DRAFT_491852 [Aaosphaeria arxii CBS 175.79]